MQLTTNSAGMDPSSREYRENEVLITVLADNGGYVFVFKQTLHVFDDRVRKDNIECRSTRYLKDNPVLVY